LLAGCVEVAFCAAAIGGESAQAVNDEGLRLAVLHAVFPGKEISIDQGQKIVNVWPSASKPGEVSFPDALAGEGVYRVVGEASNAAERDASVDIITGKFSASRRVRFKLFRWPNEGDVGLLGVFQYDFLGANPALSCPSVGLLVHLHGNAGKWEVHDAYLLQTSHHFSVQRIELLDLTGDGVHELVIESDFGGAGGGGSTLQVFGLTRGNLEELLNTNSRLEYMDEEGYSQVLDIDRTLKAHGQQFCVLKETIFEKGKWFKKPIVTRPCYRRGEGVDPKDVKMRNRMLDPLR
jgi:hypothetical protein